MYGSYYRVGTESFREPYAALRYAAENNGYAEWILPYNITNSYLGIDPRTLPDLTTLIALKSQHLLSTHKDYVFNYTGGTDSETILQSANWSNLICYTCDIEYADQEYAKGIRDNDVEVRPITRDLYDIWFDPECAYKYTDFFPGFRPIFRDYLRPGDDTYAIYGIEKPHLYKTENAYYWILRDDSDDGRRTPHCDFYFDDIVPEVAVKQVYDMKNFFQRTQPDRKGWIESKHANYEEVNRALSRVIADGYLHTKTLTDWQNTGYMNFKHRVCLETFYKEGRLEVIDAWANNLNTVSNTLRHAPNTIEVKTFKFKDWTVELPQRIIRTGAIYEMCDDGLQLIDHCDINRLT